MTYGPPLPVPADLHRRGVGLCSHVNGGFCWHRRNPHGSGHIYGAAWPTLAQAIDDARRMVRVPVQMTLVEA